MAPGYPSVLALERQRQPRRRPTWTNGRKVGSAAGQQVKVLLPLNPPRRSLSLSLAVAHCCCPFQSSHRQSVAFFSSTHRQFIPTVNMRYSALLMLAAGVFAMAQDAQPSESNTLTGIYKEASRASAMEASQRSAASVDKTRTEPRNTGLRAEASRASAMEASQRAAAAADAAATEKPNTGIRAEASRASAMEASQRAAAAADAAATDKPNTGIRAEASRASALEASQRAAAASDAQMTDKPNTGIRAEASRASAMEESQRSAAAEAAAETSPRNTGIRAEASRASAMEESQRAAAKSDAESGAQETGFPSHLIGAAGLAFAALL